MNNVQNRPLKLIDNYIFIYHLGNGEGEYVVIPTYPDSILDTMSSTFASTNALSRSAPIFAYSYSGPRTVQINLNLHRDMMQMVNYNVSTLKKSIRDSIDDDYIDVLIKKLQSISVPRYTSSSKAVQPPMVAVRFGNEIFIKGVVTGSIGVTYSTPIIEYGVNNESKYAQVQISFTVSEVDPYDADTIATQGSFRGITKAFKSGIYAEK